MKERFMTVVISVTVTYLLIAATSEPQRIRELDVDRLIVRKELIVSDTGQPWEANYEQQQMPRGIYARALGDGPGGLWVRSRLIKGEVDDPFDDRFHALETDGSLRRAPGHISWNVWLDGAWRQMAIIQGEGVEFNELPRERWNGASHPGRIRFQTFRENHVEPLTDALIGQGGMSIGGGGYGGGGLPYAADGLELWGAELKQHDLRRPKPPRSVSDDGSGAHSYAIIAIGPFGTRTEPSAAVKVQGYATLEWDSVAGADSYVVLRDGREMAKPLRIEGSAKRWTDPDRQAAEK